MKDIYLDYLEIQITDSCNLNCKGCSHCAGLRKQKQHILFDTFQKDLLRLKELIPDIKKIRILGGEPLLNPQLEECAQFARSVYQTSDIRITTNGTLLLSKNREFFEKMSHYDIGFDISVYPPTEKLLEEIKSILEQFKINYKCTPLIKKFGKRISLEANSEIEEVFSNCDSKMCNFLRDGILSPCPVPVILEWLADYYCFDVDTEAGKINIHETGLNGKEIVDFLNSPNKICRYCTEMEFFDWKQNVSPRLEDWVVRKG